MQYRAGGFAVGAWLSIVSLASLLAWCLARWWKERTGQAAAM
jgi:hypothetical protein